MKFILGKKLGMTQIWKNDKMVSVTLIQAGPVVVTQIKNKEKDGYEAAQVGFGTKKAKNIKKPQKGHFKDLGNFVHLKEFKVAGEYKVGDILNTEQFSEGDTVKVSGLNRGRGFQGGVKRYSFAGGPKTHGQKNRYRAPGSIGATAPQRVLPGTRMAGRMGQERMTVKGTVIEIDNEKNVLKIKGAVPGTKGTLIEIRSVK